MLPGKYNVEQLINLLVGFTYLGVCKLGVQFTIVLSVVDLAYFDVTLRVILL